jgi:GNAT superfamily N-acetyltransferase
MDWKMSGTTSANSTGILEQPWMGPIPVFEASTLEQIFEFRESIWRNEPTIIDAHKLDASSLRDGHDAHGLHWIITVKQSIVAAARLCIHHSARDLPYFDGFHHLRVDIPGPFASLNRLVVHPSMRRRGLSRALTNVRIDAARSKGAKTIIVEAAPDRVPGLREFGFVELGHSEALPWELVRFTLMYLNISE